MFTCMRSIASAICCRYRRSPVTADPDTTRRKLDVSEPFLCDCSVRAKDKGALLSTIDSPKDFGAGQNGAIAFATTHWSVVLTAQGESAAAQKAMERLCRIYWWPLFGFVRRQSYTPEEAQDLTQSFFALFLQRRDLEAVRRENGRLHSPSRHESQARWRPTACAVGRIARARAC
jgi:hypothetical protein